MGKRSRRSFDRLFLRILTILIIGCLLYFWGIPYINSLVKPISPLPPVESPAESPAESPVGPIVPPVEPPVPTIDKQAIVDTIMPIVAWALCALVVVGLIWVLWKNREKLLGPDIADKLRSILDEVKQIFGKIDIGDKTLGIVPERTWAPKEIWPEGTRLWTLMLTFEPHNHEDEKGFHDELYKWLQGQYPKAEYEKKIGGMKVDIDIGNIAIEVKGPKEAAAPNSMSEQALTRLNYYNNVIFALCRTKFKSGRFGEIEKAIKRQLPRVGVITYDVIT